MSQAGALPEGVTHSESEVESIKKQYQQMQRKILEIYGFAADVLAFDPRGFSDDTYREKIETERKTFSDCFDDPDLLACAKAIWLQKYIEDNLIPKLHTIGKIVAYKGNEFG